MSIIEVQKALVRKENMMAKTANLYARIEPDVKAQAEDILAALGSCVKCDKYVL